MAELRPYLVQYWVLRDGEAHSRSEREEAFSAQDAVFQVGLRLEQIYDGHRITAVDPIREG